MLQDFVVCGDYECQSCKRNHCCPETDMIEDPCIDCAGVPPYAPYDADEENICDFECDKKKSNIISRQV